MFSNKTFNTIQIIKYNKQLTNYTRYKKKTLEFTYLKSQNNILSKQI